MLPEASLSSQRVVKPGNRPAILSILEEYAVHKYSDTSDATPWLASCESLGSALWTGVLTAVTPGGACP